MPHPQGFRVVGADWQQESHKHSFLAVSTDLILCQSRDYVALHLFVVPQADENHVGWRG